LGLTTAYQNSPQKHIWRALTLLLGTGIAEIMRADVSKTADRRWQELFMSSFVEGRLREKPTARASRRA